MSRLGFVALMFFGASATECPYTQGLSLLMKGSTVSRRHAMVSSSHLEEEEEEEESDDIAFNVTCTCERVPGDETDDDFSFGTCATNLGELYYLIDDGGPVDDIPPSATVVLQLREVSGREIIDDGPWVREQKKLYRVVNFKQLHVGDELVQVIEVKNDAAQNPYKAFGWISTCPSGTMTIQTVSECRTAADSIGRHFAYAGSWKHTGPACQIGCRGKVYFNRNMYSPGAKLVCKKVTSCSTKAPRNCLSCTDPGGDVCARCSEATTMQADGTCKATCANLRCHFGFTRKTGTLQLKDPDDAKCCEDTSRGIVQAKFGVATCPHGTASLNKVACTVTARLGSSVLRKVTGGSMAFPVKFQTISTEHCPHSCLQSGSYIKWNSEKKRANHRRRRNGCSLICKKTLSCSDKAPENCVSCTVPNGDVCERCSDATTMLTDGTCQPTCYNLRCQFGFSRKKGTEQLTNPDDAKCCEDTSGGIVQAKFGAATCPSGTVSLNAVACAELAKVGSSVLKKKSGNSIVFPIGFGERNTKYAPHSCLATESWWKAKIYWNKEEKQATDRRRSGSYSLICQDPAWKPPVPSPTPVPTPTPTIPTQDGVAATVPSSEWQLRILAKHNLLRSQESASGMRKLVWDVGLEESARNWAEKCTFSHASKYAGGHSNCAANVCGQKNGENLWMSTGGNLDVEEAVEDWYAEKKDYDYADGTYQLKHCAVDKVCGHYTQVVSTITSKIGCAMVTSCTGKYKNYIVCQYDPPGNVVGAPLFKSGVSCSTCPIGYDCCEGGLCVGATPPALTGSFSWDKTCAGTPKSYKLNACEPANIQDGHQIVTMTADERTWIVRVILYNDEHCKNEIMALKGQREGVCDDKIGFNNKFTYKGTDAKPTAPGALTEGNCGAGPGTAPGPARVPAPTPATEAPTPSPTEAPTPSPTGAPTPSPTEAPTPSPTEAPTPSPTEAPTHAAPANDKAECESFISPSDFGFLTGRWTGRKCNTDPKQPACALKHVAKDFDGTYIAGAQMGQFYKMCKFKVDGTRVLKSGRYKRTRKAPASASALVDMYNGGRSSGDHYKFISGTAFSCKATTQANADCGTFMSTFNFGFLTGRWTSRKCNTDPKQLACALKHVAKDFDGTYIAGAQMGQFYKMCKFKVDGTRVPKSGRYKRTRKTPASASALVDMYNGGRSSGDHYKFISGTAFSCKATTQAKADCGTFMSTFNFGFFTGRSTGKACNTDPKQLACAVRQVAKDTDGKYIAGFRQGAHYKMCKFNGDGTRVNKSGRYKRTWSIPASASELVNMYAKSRSSWNGYIFKAGTAFLCE